MDFIITRYCLSILVLICAIKANNTNTDDNTRVSRAMRRVVKLYSGVRPDPIVCTNEGFRGDPKDCTIFYRCTKSERGKYTAFRFQCPPGTVYDPETEVCNHPQNTKRSECGGNKEIISSHYELNEIEESNELPTPISTKIPFYTTITPKPVINTGSSPIVQSSTIQSVSTTKHQEMIMHPGYSTTPSHSSFISPATSPVNIQQSTSGDICTSDGFMGDSVNCHKFYRCVGNQYSGFTKYEFSCSEPTIWDDDIKSCNHPWAVKRSRCGRNHLLGDTEGSTKSNPSPVRTTTDSAAMLNSNRTIQSQLQIAYGDRVHQTQTQISNSAAIQNQTQIFYGDRVNKTMNASNKQNQTQISHGSAVSQSQYQIGFGDDVVQTQVKIDHSKQTSQSQIQIVESTTIPTKPSSTQKQNPNKNQQNQNGTCSESGFMGDPYDCKKFYRCVDNGRGGFTRHEFSCGEGTSWDQSIEACNHAWAVKECGGKPTDTGSQETMIKSTPPSTTQSYSTTSKPTENISSSEITQSSDVEDVGYNQVTISSMGPTPSTTTNVIHRIDNDCTSSGFIGDPTNCHIFYSCVENGNGGYTKHEFKCSEGTLWDSDIGGCNHAWAVKRCGGHSVSTIETTSSTTPKLTTTLTSTVTHVVTTQNDDYDAGYGIHNEQSSPGTTIRTTKAPQESSLNLNNDCQSSGFMGDKNDCKKFYRCVSNGDGSYTRYEFMCGEGTVWDSKIESCNHAWAVDSCENSSIALANEVTTQKGPVTNYEEIGNGYITPENEDSELSTKKSTVSTTSSKTTHSLEQNKCSKNGFIGDITDCKKFYRCVDNGDGSFIQYEFTCGEGTVWDQKIEACNHAWAVDKCGANYETDHVEATTSVYNVTVRDEEPVHAYPVAEYPIQKDEVTHETTQSTSITTSALPSSPCNKNGFIGDKRDCKIFYRCVNDGNGSFSKFEFKCGEGTVWDQSIEACNHAWAVKDCGAVNDTLNNKNESTTQAVFVSSSEYYTDNSSPTSDINENEISDECKREGFAGDTKDCKRFYRCVDNGQGGFTKYEFRCGEGTYWNEKIEACDHALSDNPCQENENTHVTKEPQHMNDETQLDTTTKITTLLATGSHEDISITKKPQSSGAPCALEGFFGDQDDCQKFYRCVDDGSGRYTKYGFTCGDGTVWDQELLTCVHKSERNACSLHSTVTSSRPQEPSHDNENSFISSTTHVPHKTSTATTDVPKQTSTENTTVAYQCTTEGFYANPTDCRKFIRCVNDGKGTFTKYDFACGDGTIWIQEILACDHDDGTAACHSSSQNEWTSRPQTNVESSTFSNIVISSTTAQNLNTNKTDDDYNTEVTKVPQVLKDDCQSEGFYGDKDDCQKYYRCVANNNNGFSKYEFICGEGTAWDSNLQTCNHNSGNNCRVSNQTENPTEFVVHDEISESTQSGSPSSTSTSSTESTESTSTPSKDICEKAGFFGNTKDCTKFYRCVDDGEGGLTKYDFTCGDGTIWDQDLLTCNHPHDVVNPSCKLNQGETSENTTTSPETSSTSKTTESSEPNSTSSSTTTQSSQSTTTTTESSSNCSQVESSKNPGNKNVTCTKAGYYADPSDCKKFYRCVDWDGNGEKFSVYFFECGEGTIWDPALDTCNHEESVYPPRNCSNSQSSSSGQETTTTEESTTQETTTSEKTTTQSTSSESTTQQTTTSEKTTTEQTTSSEQTTTQQTTTSEKTTTEQSTTSEPTTTQQSTTTDKITTTQPTTTEQTTTQQPTSSETTTTEQSTTTSDGTTTQQIDSTTETTTQQATTTEAVTESTTDKTTTQESTTISSTTTEKSSTTDSTTEQSTTSEQTTTESGTSTTESNQQTSTTENQHETTTDHSPHSSSCPDTEDDQYLFVCPTSFKRHPKYCNLFYQCTEDDDTHEVKVAVFNCPNNTIYDESKVQCVEEDKADKKCDGEIAARRRVKRVGASHKEPIVVTKDSQKCVMEGHMSFEKNSECSPAFLKCERTKSGALRGYVHRCPQNYVYWSISRRCEREEVVRDCKRTINNWNGRWEIPIDRQNVAW